MSNEPLLIFYCALLAAVPIIAMRLAVSLSDGQQVGLQMTMRIGSMILGDGTIQVEYEHEVARIVVDRPSKRNALSLSMWHSIPMILREIRANPAILLVVIEGRGDEAFSAGADIEELENLSESRNAALEYMDVIQAAETALGACELPTIASIRGFCVGGGLELAMACDLRFASDHSSFMAPPARLGIAYSLSSTRRLSLLVGESRAKEMLFSAREIDANEAFRIGLVNRVFTRATFADDLSMNIARMLRNSQLSIRNTKLILDVIRSGHEVDTSEIRELRARGFTEIDFAEGVDAFKTRRRANFKWGREPSL